jgi:RecA-family ATPase
VKQCAVSPFIIIDSLAAFFEGEDENDAAAMRAFIDEGRVLLKAGACGILILHHSGKSESSKTYRGSSDLKAAIDSGYVLVN